MNLRCTGAATGTQASAAGKPPPPACRLTIKLCTRTLIMLPALYSLHKNS